MRVIKLELRADSTPFNYFRSTVYYDE